MEEQWPSKPWAASSNLAEVTMRYYIDTIVKERNHYTNPIAKWVEEQLTELSTDLELVDNFRIARQSINWEVYEYNRTKSVGCCGYVDEIKTCPINKAKYMIGFNYGH